MSVAWRVGSVWLLTATLTAGCGGVRGSVVTLSPRTNRRLEQADALARVGRFREARDGYVVVLTENAVGVDRALLGLARLALDPRNPERDDRQGTAYLDRLLADYPESEWATEGRTWRTLVSSVERLQQDIRRMQQDLSRLRRELQREQHETVRFRMERDQLRQIDLELERPRAIQSVRPPSAELLRD